MLITKDILKKIYKKRNVWSHKGNFGKLLIVGGSKLYSGSPTLAALAAYRSGCDLVTIMAPERAANIIATFSPDLITYPLKGDYLNKNHLKEIFSLAKNYDAIVIGGGLCKNKETIFSVNKILKRISIPIVVDADAIYAIKNKLDKNFVLTPHAHEFFVLSGIKLKNNINYMKKIVKDTAKKFECVILLKSHVDIISDGKKVALNKTGNPFMTKGGTGDTLAGICGALLARKINPYYAACASAYINGKAGDLAAKKYGESMLASDLLNEIKDVIKRNS
ncbi:MAG: NAD(P)H-hydrate dehydratase [Candidatus Aenigmatarchaeota archaeon]